MRTLQFKISGMHCASCAKIIKINIEELSGIQNIEVDIKGGTANVSAEDLVKPEDVLVKIKEAGYEAEMV